MKNQYFQNLKAQGLQYRKINNGVVINNQNGLFTVGVSAAFKFWAIADRYNASDIYVDVLPSEDQIEEFIATFRKAKIHSIVIANTETYRENDLASLGCTLDGECKVFRKERELYSGQLEIIKGIRVLLDSESND